MLSFTTDPDGKLEIKLTNKCVPQKSEPRSDARSDGSGKSGGGLEGSDGRSGSGLVVGSDARSGGLEGSEGRSGGGMENSDARSGEGSGGIEVNSEGRSGDMVGSVESLEDMMDVKGLFIVISLLINYIGSPVSLSTLFASTHPNS